MDYNGGGASAAPTTPTPPPLICLELYQNGEKRADLNKEPAGCQV
jgi:hypothetical protein